MERKDGGENKVCLRGTDRRKRINPQNPDSQISANDKNSRNKPKQLKLK